MKKTLLLLFAFVLSIGTAWADKTVYLQPGVWNTDNPVFAVWAFGAVDTELNPDKFITMSEIGESGYYKAEVPDAYKKILFFRGPSADWEAAWKNQTDDITSFENNTLFKITGWVDSPNGKSGYNADPMNFSLLGTATASFAALPAVNANDGNKGTRWGSEGGQDDTWLQIAWGEAQTFNTVKIYCEGAMNAANAPALAFDIQTSDNGEAWTTRKHVWGKNADGSYITVVLNENVTAKYVRFQGVKQGVYGYSFWEFEVYNTDYSGKTLNSIELSTYKNVTKTNAGRTIALSLIGKTAEDEEIPTGAITWNNTTPAVGTVTNETFNALTVGTTTVSATAGGKTSEEITFTVTAPQVLGSISLPHTFWSAIQGYGPFTVAVLDTDGNDFEGDVTLSWVDDKAPVGAEINGKNITFGAASGEGIFTLQATDGVTTVTAPVYMVGNNAVLTTPDDAVAIYAAGTDNDWQYWNGGATQDNTFTLGTTPVKAFTDTRCVFVGNKDLHAWNADVNPTEEGYTSVHFSIYSPIEGQKINISFEQTTTIGNNHLQTLEKGWHDYSVDLTGETKIHTLSLRNEHANAGEEGPSIAVANIYYTKESVALTEGYYVVGTMTATDWALDNNYKMTLNEGATGTEYMLTSVALTNNTELKAVYSADGTAITTWYPDEMGNNYTITADGDYNIYCRPNADGGGDWHEGVLYVARQITNLTLSPSGNVEMEVGDDGDLEVTDQSGNAVAASLLNFESANTSVVTIDGNGHAEAVAEGGPVVVTVSLKSDPSVTATLNVTVTAATPNTLIDTPDPVTGIHVLTGTWDGDEFATLDATAQATAYDVSGLAATFDGSAITTVKKNALFIARADQNIGKNKVVDNGDNTYTGTNIEILDYSEYNGLNTEMNTSISPITGPVAYHRVLPRAGIYLTQVVPFDVAVPSDCNAYEATTSTNNAGTITITFTEVNTLQAGVPYLMHATNGGVHFNVGGLDFSEGSDQALTDGVFKGTYAPINPVPANTYVMPKGDDAVNAEFRKASTGSYIPAFRAYIQLNTSGAKINVLFDDTTGIHAATAEQLEAIFNIYSIDGKLVRQNSDSKVGLEKGIYIINGKKVIVK